MDSAWARPPVWTAARASVVILCAAALLILAGCAGELPDPGGVTTTAGGATTSTTEEQTVTLGRQVGVTWEEAIQALLSLLTDRPAVASVQPAVADLKEQYVQRMVALGRQIRTLDAAGQQSVYARVEDILASKADADWFTAYKAVYEHYTEGTDQAAQDFAILLSTFNTLTEYAFFDVLKAQEPEEAARLGVE